MVGEPAYYPKTTSFTESLSFFDVGNTATRRSLLPRQRSVSDPSLPSLESATGLLVSDLWLQERLRHFPDDIYDLRPTSHLVRFMSALMGPSGAGQLRLRNTVALFQTTLHSTHFYDLDAFYGVLFGAVRQVHEALGLNGHTALCTQDEWESITVSDTSYRERISRLAKAINMGATLPGIQAVAEALFGVPCDIYEVWALKDSADPTYGSRVVAPATPPDTGGNRTWGAVESAFPTWGDLDGNSWQHISDPLLALSPEMFFGLTSGQRMWSDVETDFPTFLDAESATWAEIEYAGTPGGGGGDTGGGTGTGTHVWDGTILPDEDNRATFIIRPKKEWDDPYQQVADIHSVSRVIDRLKPAGTRYIIEPKGVGLLTSVDVASLASDSNYWQVIAKVTPRRSLVASVSATYPVSTGQAAAGITSYDTHELPKPAFTTSQTTSWTYNAEITQVKAYSQDQYGNPADPLDFESVRYLEGTTVKYTPDKGVLDARQAIASRYARDGVIQAAPFSDARVVVPTSG